MGTTTLPNESYQEQAGEHAARTTPTRYLDLLGVATRTGYSYDHVRRMGRTGQLPAADAEVGDRLGWLPATIDAWVATRTTAPTTRTTTTTTATREA